MRATAVFVPPRSTANPVGFLRSIIATGPEFF
jgi:hypothetical protein